VASSYGVPCAWAVLEAAEEGLHLFGLFDCVRLYSLAPTGHHFFAPLLDYARHWYAQREKSSFTYLAEEDQALVWNPSGMTDLGAADLLSISTELMPDFLEYLSLITAPRPPIRAEASSPEPTTGSPHG
jgi:hypothetical protein